MWRFSNLIEYGYPIGALNWTGDDPCIFPVDCPNFGGFVSSTTVVRYELLLHQKLERNS